MTGEAHQKVAAHHLRRNAYLYVRQSSLRQVFENTESTKRQYALRERAVALGWPLDQIVVVDCDQGISGASAADREGFQRLVTEVGMGRAGIVMGLEVSRLARNSSDWHRLLEMCALSGTLILDEDGVYDPAHFNDRLLLGLKGTMSEAELHVLRARLRGGILNKARRGELELPLPAGFVYDDQGRVILDPDQRVHGAVTALFATFRRTGSATAIVKAFRRDALLFPGRANAGPAKGSLVWRELGHARALWVLHNPRYAGAFVFGRTRQCRAAQGTSRVQKKLPREEWTILLPGAHAGYISWEEFEDNQRRLRDNSACRGEDRRTGPPREGPALLQGLAICGVCGQRMSVRYHSSRGHLSPDYVCQRPGSAGERPCQHITGAPLDRAIGELLVQAVTPLALEVGLAVQDEIAARVEAADRLRRQSVEHAQYEADLARRRFMQVDPERRLVADSLEAEWNAKLKALAAAHEEYERARERDLAVISDEQRATIMALASDFPRLWNDPATPQRERKRMVRLLLEDVTVLQCEAITAHVRFRGGATTTLTVPRARSAWALRQTSPEVVTAVDRLLDDHTDAEIAALLADRGFRSGMGRPITAMIVASIRKRCGLKPLYSRLRDRGLLTLEEMARALGVAPCTIKTWHRAGLLIAQACNGQHRYLFVPPDNNAPVRYKRKGLTAQRRLPESATHQTNEVQCEA